MFWNSELKKEVKDNYDYLFDALNCLEQDFKEAQKRQEEAQGAIANLVSLLKIYDERQQKSIKVDEDWRLMADEKMNGFLQKCKDLEAFILTAISQEQNKRIGLGERIVKLEEILKVSSPEFTYPTFADIEKMKQTGTLEITPIEDSIKLLNEDYHELRFRIDKLEESFNKQVYFSAEEIRNISLGDTKGVYDGFSTMGTSGMGTDKIKELLEDKLEKPKEIR